MDKHVVKNTYEMPNVCWIRIFPLHEMFEVNGQPIVYMTVCKVNSNKSECEFVVRQRLADCTYDDQ